MDKIPMLVDTEVETSLELDEEEQIHKKVSSNATTYNATNTLFNVAYEEVDNEKYESVELKDYESRLHQVMKEWKSVYQDAHNLLKQSKQKHPIVDKGILPPEKREYLEKAEDLQNFIRESLQFREQAVLFLEYDYAEYVFMLENLETLYEQKLNLLKANKIAEHLANRN